MVTLEQWTRLSPIQFNALSIGRFTKLDEWTRYSRLKFITLSIGSQSRPIYHVVHVLALDGPSYTKLAAPFNPVLR